MAGKVVDADGKPIMRYDKTSEIDKLVKEMEQL